MTSSLTRISYKDEQMENQRKSIKDWHFERCDKGVKPVEGKYDPSNPNHIKPSDVIKIYGPL